MTICSLNTAATCIVTIECAVARSCVDVNNALKGNRKHPHTHLEPRQCIHKTQDKECGV